MKHLLLSGVLIALLTSCSDSGDSKIVVAISANAEWRIVQATFPDEHYQATPWGEYFEKTFNTAHGKQEVVFFHEGWGKTAAAGATQYAIDRWKPECVINLGTCGGIKGKVNRYQTLLVDETIIYDIKEAMGDSQQAIDDYTTKIDLSWLSVSSADSVIQTRLVSADRDLVPSELEELTQRYHAIAGDWESASIAYTCARNKTRMIILRGVSDLVDTNTGEAYHNEIVFQNGTEVVMSRLIKSLPFWLDRIPSDKTK